MLAAVIWMRIRRLNESSVLDWPDCIDRWNSSASCPHSSQRAARNKKRRRIYRGGDPLTRKSVSGGERSYHRSRSRIDDCGKKPRLIVSASSFCGNTVLLLSPPFVDQVGH